MKNYYVYVYIDPRNHEEFYYGKGQGSRKNVHLGDDTDTEKSQRIKAIHKAGLEPIIRVIASRLTEHEALLIEKTLLWKLGKMLTNVASGHYADKFRPHDKLHTKLAGFDYENGLYFYNVGEGKHRNWDDYRNFGFISAGQRATFRDAMLGFHPGDVVAAYLSKCGYVGVGRILGAAKRINEAKVNGKPCLSLPLRCKDMDDNADSETHSEYVCPVEWIVAVERSDARFVSKSGLYTPRNVRASLDGQQATIDFLNEQFDIDIESLVE